MVWACTAAEEAVPVAENVPVQKMRFSAVPEASVKTTLDGGTVQWDAQDRISVFDGYGNRCFTIESIRGDGSAVFVGEAVSGQPCYYACYPYRESNLLSGGNRIVTSISPTQSASAAGSFDNGINVSVAASADGTFAFKNLGGLLRVFLPRNNVTSIRLTANDGGAVAGTYQAQMNADGSIASIQSASAETSLTLTPSGNATFPAGEYFLCVPARTYTGGLKLLLDTSEGEQIQAGTIADVVVERSKKTNIGTVDTRADKAHRTLVFTPIESLNQASQVNSHAGWTQYSSLMPISGTDVVLESDVLGTGPDYQYPRVVKASNGDYLLFYHPSGNGVSTAGNRSHYLRSSDLQNWTYEKNLFKPYSITDSQSESNTRAYAGADVVRLPDGKILAVAATRALKNYVDRIPDNGLSIRISADNGATWGDEQLILLGTVWEPFPVVLSSGRIQIYYTDYNAATGGTGVSYIYSDDNGATWTPGASEAHARAFAQVWYLDGGSNPVMTDQMPAVVQLNGTNKLVGAGESKVGTGSSYAYRISLAYSDESGSWGTPDANGVLPSTRDNNFCAGAAPYLIQFPSGETVLTYNLSSLSGLRYRMGDHLAGNFSEEKGLLSGTNLFWGSTALADSHRMIAAIGGNAQCLKLGQYYLNHAITVSSRTVTLDSRTPEWETGDEAVYLCSFDASKATVRAAANAGYLFLLAEVEDADLSESDYMEMTFVNIENPTPGLTSLRIKANFRGLVQVSRYSGGWQSVSDAVTVKAAYDGTATGGDTDHGYLLEVGIPLNLLPMHSGQLLMTCVLSDVNNAGPCSVSVPLLGLPEDSFVGTAGNGNTGTGCTWTYDDDLEW